MECSQPSGAQNWRKETNSVNLFEDLTVIVHQNINIGCAAGGFHAHMGELLSKRNIIGKIAEIELYFLKFF